VGPVLVPLPLVVLLAEELEGCFLAERILRVQWALSSGWVVLQAPASWEETTVVTPPSGLAQQLVVGVEDPTTVVVFLEVQAAGELFALLVGPGPRGRGMLDMVPDAIVEMDPVVEVEPVVYRHTPI
jgi:hypothetical protein